MLRCRKIAGPVGRLAVASRGASGVTSRSGRGGGHRIVSVQPSPKIFVQRVGKNGIGVRRLQHYPEDAIAGKPAGQMLIQRVCHREDKDRLKPGRQLALTGQGHCGQERTDKSGGNLPTRHEKNDATCPTAASAFHGRGANRAPRLCERVCLAGPNSDGARNPRSPVLCCHAERDVPQHMADFPRIEWLDQHVIATEVQYLGPEGCIGQT